MDARMDNSADNAGASSGYLLQESGRERDRDFTGQIAKLLMEATGLVRRPQRLAPLIKKVTSDKLRFTFRQKHLYSYTTSKYPSGETLKAVMRWVLQAQRADGGIAAYYSLLTGYSESYPEVTGYLIPTLYDYSLLTGDSAARLTAESATRWLMSLQMPSGAFPGGLQGRTAEPSVFNTGQILQGLVRAYVETNNPGTLQGAMSAGDWLVKIQEADGSWSGDGAYQNRPHTYYSMVAWSLAELCERTAENKYGVAAERNLDWVLLHFRAGGWVDGINLQGHPKYLHFIAYVLQGVLECAVLRQRDDAIQAVANSAWMLLRKFESNKQLAGAYDSDFTNGARFTCLTGNAQMSCVWLRLFDMTKDLRYLNAALKMNEMLKQLIPIRGRNGIDGGVSGSYPIWGRYQPLRNISWGCKFFADALMLEDRVMRVLDPSSFEALQCAS
jgi:hypothetical protein